MLGKDDLKEYFEGKKLYGDDFSLSQIVEWFKDEEEAYYKLYGVNYQYGGYGYHQLNRKHGFSYLPANKTYDKVLSLGGAFGEELFPIKEKINSIIILESSENFKKTNKDPSITYVKSIPSGELPFPDKFFDLVTCFGALHHIPNVSRVIKEIFRCTVGGGIALIREPITSMGDWRKNRKGVTKRERGIPLQIFRQIINDVGFSIIRETKCVFSLTSRLQHFTKGSVYNSKMALMLDRFFCMLFGWNTTYHTKNLFLKLRPTSVFYVLQKK